MINFNYDTLIIDRALRGTLYGKTTGSAIFTIDQIMNPQLSVTVEQVFVTNALGIKIATFDRSKGAKFTAENSQINLGLMAAQSGKLKTNATVGAPIPMEKTEIVTVGGTTGVPGTTVTLQNVPLGTAGSEIPYIYRLNSDNSISTPYAIDITASATKFSLVSATKVLTFPTPTAGDVLLPTDRFMVNYTYSATAAIKIENSTTTNSMGGIFKLEVMFADWADVSTKYYGFVVFPSVRLDPNFDIKFANDSTHAFGFECLQDNISIDKNLYYFLVA